ncbi:MAG: efflux RND transporter periplasmic adaptor subunit [Spirochaetes bacterium]|nr:efflux RND transporter periplasmic adaptor subunit [Spirochaetota bacterium]
MNNGKKKRKIWYILLPLLVLGISATIMAFAANGNKDQSMGEMTAFVEKRMVDNSIEIFGRLKARAEQEIQSASGGTVEQVFVKVGDQIRKGDKIATLESLEAAYELERFAYQLEQERFTGNARRIALMETEYELKKRTLDNLTIKAHLDGKISRLDLKPGDVIRAGESYGRVIDVSSLAADVEISESDIPRTRIGLPVQFRFPALPGLQTTGRLDSFAAEARVNERGLTVLNARLLIDQPPTELLPAYSFNASILAGDPIEALIVDPAAILWNKGQPEVERRNANGGWERVQVETEGFGSGYTRILYGVSEGDELKIQPAPAPRF